MGAACRAARLMGRGGNASDFAERERRAAEGFGRMAKQEGVDRVIYLGGLGDNPGSEHLRSRHETASQLAAHGPPLTYFRAGMVVGSESVTESSARTLFDIEPAPFEVTLRRALAGDQGGPPPQ
jgi:uncharacterized protein YbjT (DUF2867 family)